MEKSFGIIEEQIGDFWYLIDPLAGKLGFYGLYEDNALHRYLVYIDVPRQEIDKPETHKKYSTPGQQVSSEDGIVHVGRGENLYGPGNITTLGQPSINHRDEFFDYSQRGKETLFPDVWKMLPSGVIDYNIEGRPARRLELAGV